MSNKSTLKSKVLIVDDEINFSESLKMTLEDTYAVEIAHSLLAAREFLSRHCPDALLIDVRLPDGDGIEFLKEVGKLEYSPVIIIMTAFATVNSAIDALKKGAVDYFTKPIDIDRLRRELYVYLENRLLQRRIADLNQTINRISPPFVTAGTGQMKTIMQQVPLIAPLDIPVLITGQTGTGKEKLAQWIHSLSRPEKEMITINCSALSKDIIESELFGHAKGAYTGAVSQKDGLIERADGGTLFLDEIGELPESIQAKFLRVLESGVYYRVGDPMERFVSFRLISASNKDLSDPLSCFRRDLFFRIRGALFELPSLIHRKDDIPLLISIFIDQANTAYNKAVKGISPSAMQAILSYRWPGNIRELKWAVHRAVAISSTDTIGKDEISVGVDSSGDFTNITDIDERIPFLEAKGRLEKKYIKNALEIANNNKTEAAKILGISARALHYKIIKYRI